MKIQAIGDIHGRDCWKSLIDLSCNKIIFIGDYCDSFDYSDVFILHNLKEIIEFKKQYPYKVELLIGNHDWCYMFHNFTSISGFRHFMFPSLNILFRDNIDLFNMAYQYKDILYSHAGLSEKYYQNYISEYHEEGENYADVLNKLWVGKPNVFYRVPSSRSLYRTQDYGCPLWEDYDNIKTQAVSDVRHVIGHTAIKEINHTDIFGVKVTNIDVLTDDEEKLPEKPTLILEL